MMRSTSQHPDQQQLTFDILTAHRYEGLFISLQVIGGQIGLPLFIATMLLARSVKRHYILVNFCFSWIVYSVAYCLT